MTVFYLRDPRRHAVPAGMPAGTSYAEEDQMFEVRPDRLATMARRLGRNLVPVFGRNVPKASFGMELGTPLGLVLGGLLVGLGIGLARRRPLWGLFVAATVGMVLLVPKPADRYLLPVLPLLVFAWWSFLRRLNLELHRRRVRWGNWAFLALFALGATANGEQVFDFVFEQRRPHFLEAYKDGRYASVYEAAALVRRHTGPSGSAASPQTTWVLVGPKYARILTLLGDRYAIEPETARRSTRGPTRRGGTSTSWSRPTRTPATTAGTCWTADADRPRVAGPAQAGSRPRAHRLRPEQVPGEAPVWTLHAIRPKPLPEPATAPAPTVPITAPANAPTTEPAP